MTPEQKKQTFLVVDDDGQVRDILIGYLKSFGFEKIIEAKDGKAALKIIQNHTQKIDYIISDWEMPHVDGLTLLRAVRKDPAREMIKFIMVTSQGSRERIKITKAAQSRVDAYVVKPFRGQVLLEKINNLMNGVIDSSVDEFESSLMREVPSNDMQEKKPLGRVIIDKEPKGEGYVKDISSEAATPSGHVIHKTTDEEPPEDYDLKQMNVTLIVKLAKSYIKVGWFAKAVKLCQDAHALFPGSSDVLYQLAYAYYMQGDHEEAKAQLERVFKISPYHAEGQTLRSEIKSLKKAVA
jgi:two-component system, chemotaxis family, chemotaxis protein CheY